MHITNTTVMFSQKVLSILAWKYLLPLCLHNLKTRSIKCSTSIWEAQMMKIMQLWCVFFENNRVNIFFLTKMHNWGWPLHSFEIRKRTAFGCQDGPGCVSCWTFLSFVAQMSASSIIHKCTSGVLHNPNLIFYSLPVKNHTDTIWLNDLTCPPS